MATTTNFQAFLDVNGPGDVYERQDLVDVVNGASGHGYIRADIDDCQFLIEGCRDKSVKLLIPSEAAQKSFVARVAEGGPFPDLDVDQAVDWAHTVKKLNKS